MFRRSDCGVSRIAMKYHKYGKAGGRKGDVRGCKNPGLYEKCDLNSVHSRSVKRLQTSFDPIDAPLNDYLKKGDPISLQLEDKERGSVGDLDKLTSPRVLAFHRING